jgi:hemerythrin-like domain-containing protein
MDVIELLTEDHQKVIDLLDQFESLKENPEKNKSKLQKLFSTVQSDLEVHIAAEEEFFYPKLQEEEETHDLILESLNEHQAVKSLLSELEKEQVDGKWISKMSSMKEQVSHHIEKEENELFEKAVDILDEDEIDMIGESIYQLKKAA